MVSRSLFTRRVHGGQTLVEISVQGRTDAAVVLEALRVRVVGWAAPVKGTVYFTGQGCGGGMGPRSFAVDLEMDRPIARSVQSVEDAASTPARRMPYRVSAAKDPEVLMVDALTVDCDCRWYLTAGLLSSFWGCLRTSSFVRRHGCCGRSGLGGAEFCVFPHVSGVSGSACPAAACSRRAGRYGGLGEWFERNSTGVRARCWGRAGCAGGTAHLAGVAGRRSP